jgi:aldehyde dehydrogenase (NAD+)
MLDLRQFYIDGEWLSPIKAKELAVLNPATEQAIATISLGGAADIDLAVAAARNAFDSFGYTSKEERLKLLQGLLEVYMDRYQEMAAAISAEMGAPIDYASNNQAACGSGHLKAAIDALKNYTFESQLATGRVVKEPIGVCGFITPWNWPINQVACKVAPAFATGCTSVLKGSELSPLSSHLFAEMVHEAGYPKGVFNLVDGLGPEVGAAISSHPDIDMVSFTGSTAAGIAVSKAAAETVKRVTLELGGKSPNIILDHDDFAQAVKQGVRSCFGNVGQSCNAPTRMLLPKSRYEEAIAIGEKVANATQVGDPEQSGKHIGPLVSKVHFDRVQFYIQKGIDEGARLVAGGVGKPEGFETGYFTKPTLFADVNNDMTIAREEIFGPVLCMIPFEDEADALSIANDTPYGLAAYVSGEAEAAERMAQRLRAGMISINGGDQGFDCPFGGYKQSGNGREWGEFGFDDYLEIKTISV